jgi:hypothetical protein
MSDDIRVLKFVSGEEVVCTIRKADMSGFSIVDCLIIIMQINQQTGRPEPVLLPWGHAVKGDKLVKTAHILYLGEPVDNLLERYNDTFGRVVTTTKGLVLPE